MLETKVLEVSSSEVQKTIEELQCFGWHLISNQKVDYTTTYKTGGGNAKDGYRYIVHNDRTIYNSLTFQRDTQINNYYEINELFSNYETNCNQIMTLITQLQGLYSKRIKKNILLYSLPLIIGIVLLIISLVIMTTDYSDNLFLILIAFFIISSILLFVGSILFIVGIVKNKKAVSMKPKTKEEIIVYEKMLDLEKKNKDIANEAKKLII